MILDHQPVPLEGFKGLYGIDEFTDNVPRNYSIDELNFISYGDELKTRDGFDIAHLTASVTRFAVYRRQGEAARILVLTGEAIKDLTTGNTILTVPGMKNFAINYANNRAYISPTNGVSGLPGSFVYMYNGTGVARKAGGTAPIAGFIAAVSTTSGVIEAGTHIFAWVFETDSGFVTSPSDAQTLLFDGSKAVDFTNIPIGPFGTAARRLLASRAIQDYNGNPLAYEMFFVSGGRINNNTDTTLAGVDFFDADLQFSADYTYDQLAEIPATVFIVPYGKRMTYGGPDIDKNLVYISKPLEPESIHSSAGFIPFDPFESEGVKDATEFRDNLYVMKRNKTSVVRDNGFEPSTWNPVNLDGSIGCDINGIARYWDTTGSKVEFFTVAAPSGIYKFSGTYEEIPITRNIKRLWERYNKKYLNKGQITFDQEKMLLYVLVTLDSTVEPSHILVCNYENGFTLQAVKWHLWSFKDFAPSSIGVDRDSEKNPVFKVSSLSGNIYGQVKDKKDDVITAIEQRAQFSMIGGSANTISHCGGIGYRIKGNGTLITELWGHDNVDFQMLRTLNLANIVGKEKIIHAHFQSERISLKILLNEAGAYLKLNRANVYTNTIFNSRPGVT